MNSGKGNKELLFYDLKWDTEFFGVKSAKAILGMPLTNKQWVELNDRFEDYQFISIENRDSDPINTQLIGKETSAFLADINIQFQKKLKGSFQTPKNITVHQAMNKNAQILAIADFQFSKFTEDPQLALRGGDQVYHQWLINSFGKTDKYFAINTNVDNEINGFLLHSYSGDACVIELIAVSKSATTSGIGTMLFKAVENEAYQKGYKKIKVGTQIRNNPAINFYQKVGCKQVGCHQVYHLWNL
jgi:dTDP-4-amino-4,6-dideoxy-D-galactose acyltransferase